MKEREEKKDVSTINSGRTGDWRALRNSPMQDAAWGYNHGRILSCAATRDHIGVCGPTAAGLCFQQRLGRHPWSRLPPGVLLVSKGYI